MKISYERLNQIIEEEVSRFKRLNEEGDTVLPGKVNLNLDFKKFNDAVVKIKDSIKDQSTLDRLASQLEQMSVSQPSTAQPKK